jgi:hypothetical protein
MNIFNGFLNYTKYSNNLIDHLMDVTIIKQAMEVMSTVVVFLVGKPGSTGRHHT